MSETDWHIIDDGRTIGTEGSESGTIVRDEEHSLGARITLEEECAHARYSITCGIYGSMTHTAFAATEEEGAAKYEAMRIGLVELMQLENTFYHNELASFVEQF